MEKSQQKIVISAGITAGVFFFFWILVLIPLRGRIRQLSDELEAAGSKISEVEAAFGRDEDLARGMFQAQQELSELEKKLYSGAKVPEILKTLALAARGQDVEVISLRPEEIEVCPDGEGNPLLLNNLSGRRLPVQMRLEGEFRSLGNYFTGLVQRLPVLFTIEELKIENTGETGSALRADVLFSVYLVGE